MMATNKPVPQRRAQEAIGFVFGAAAVVAVLGPLPQLWLIAPAAYLPGFVAGWWLAYLPYWIQAQRFRRELNDL